MVDKDIVADQAEKELITRREAIFRVSAMLGGVALVGQTAMLAGCAAPQERSSSSSELFSDSDIELLDEIAETILPETSTPGAKAAGVGPFIAMMVTDTYYPDDQDVFRSGLQDVQTRSLVNYGAHFIAITDANRLELVRNLDAEQHRFMETRPPGAAAHYFRMIKELTLLGYFTSEIGCTQAMRYMETPGRYDPCVPYEKGETAWADHA